MLSWACPVPQVPGAGGQPHTGLALCPRKPGKAAGQALPPRTRTQESRSTGSRKAWALRAPLPSLVRQPHLLPTYPEATVFSLHCRPCRLSHSQRTSWPSPRLLLVCHCLHVCCPWNGRFPILVLSHCPLQSPKPEGPSRSSGGSAAGMGGSLVVKSLMQGADEEVSAPAAAGVLQDCLSK